MFRDRIVDRPRRHPRAIPRTHSHLTWRWEFIIALVRQHKWKRGAELGILKGDTFLRLLEKCPELTLIGVDLWAEQPENTGPQTYVGRDFRAYEAHVRARAARYGQRAIIVKDWTHNAAASVADGSLDFVFIDADHSSESVRRDILRWAPKVRASGAMMGHDINWPEVRSVVGSIYPEYVTGPDNCWLCWAS